MRRYLGTLIMISTLGHSLTSIAAPLSSMAAPLSTTAAQALLQSGHFAELDRSLTALQRAFEAGSSSEEDLRDAFRAFYPTDPALAAKFDMWVEKFPRSYVAHLARAIYLKRLGMDQRGGAYIDSTSREQVDRMEDSLSKASEDLRQSVELTKKPILSYVQQIDIAGTRGAPDKGRKFLDLALRIDARTFVPRARFMYNLQIRGGGSLQAMTAFFEECKGAGLSRAHLNSLESILLEEQGWAHLHVDEDGNAAEADYRRAKELDPDLCLTCFKKELSDLLLRQEKYAEAIGVLSDLLAHDPTNDNELFDRGVAYMRSGDTPKAIGDWTLAAERGNSSAQNEIGRLYMTGVPGLIEPNNAAGMEWFSKSAAQGNAAGRQNFAAAVARSSQ